MRWVSILFLGLGAAALLAGCGGRGRVAVPEGEFPPIPAIRTVMPFRGVVLRVNRPGEMEFYRKRLAQIAAAGADTVLLVAEMHRETPASNVIYIDMRSTPVQERMGELMDEARRLKLRVGMMPVEIIDRPDAEGGKTPERWDEWFDSYQWAACHFAGTAHLHTIDFFVVGAGFHDSQHLADKWRRTILAVREVYQGPVMYVANWGDWGNVPFWDGVDAIGVDAAHAAGEDRGLRDLARRAGEPVMFVNVDGNEALVRTWRGDAAGAGFVWADEAGFKRWAGKEWKRP